MKPARVTRAMVETRRLYRFEKLFFAEGFVARERSIEYLRELAARVWTKHGRRGVRVPDIKLDRTEPVSYCRGYVDIGIVPQQKSIDVLLHELVHAIGYRNHGRSFVRKYVELLVEFGGCEEGELRLALSLFNIKS